MMSVIFLLLYLKKILRVLPTPASQSPFGVVVVDGVIGIVIVMKINFLMPDKKENCKIQ